MQGTQTVVDSREFVSELCDSLRTTLVGMRPIVVSVTAESHAVLLDRAVAIGLIINELLTNALKHAFPDPDQPGRVVVEFRRCGDDFCLTVRDNGTGIEGAPRGSGIGQSLVRALTGQLGGRLEMEHADPGTAFVVLFPAETPEPSA